MSQVQTSDDVEEYAAFFPSFMLFVFRRCFPAVRLFSLLFLRFVLSLRVVLHILVSSLRPVAAEVFKIFDLGSPHLVGFALPVCWEYSTLVGVPVFALLLRRRSSSPS